MSMGWDEHAGPDAYRDENLHASPPIWTRVYQKGAHIAHLLVPGDGDIACDYVREVSTGPGELDFDLVEGPLNSLPGDSWLGTGDQDEYEHAQRLALCADCFARRESTVDDPRLGRRHNRSLTDEH